MNSESIMNYLKETFNFDYSNSFVRNTFINIIEYGINKCDFSENELAYYLSNMFDELEFEEIRDFICIKSSNVYDVVSNMNNQQIRKVFSKIKTLKNSNPEVENVNNDPDDRWDLFDILEFHCLKKLLNTDSLVDDYDDATGKLEWMDFNDYIKYYEDKQFGTWNYEFREGSYLEVPVLIDNDYKEKQEYIDYRTELEKDFLLSIENRDLKWKNKYLSIIYSEFEKNKENENYELN